MHVCIFIQIMGNSFHQKPGQIIQAAQQKQDDSGQQPFVFLSFLNALIHCVLQMVLRKARDSSPAFMGIIQRFVMETLIN